MSKQNWKPVANALIGTWPSQVSSWGHEVLAAYCSELDARGVEPAAALVAIRAYNPDADFPPSAAKLAQLARKDPSKPVGLELVAVLWGTAGVMHARAPYPIGGWRGPDGRSVADDAARRDAAVAHGPLLTAFVDSVGIDALKCHDPSDPEWGEANRRWLASEWDAFCGRADERGVAAMLERMSGDPLDELRRRRQQSIDRSQTA